MTHTSRSITHDTSLMAAFVAIQQFLSEEAKAAEAQLSPRLTGEDIRADAQEDYDWFMKTSSARQIAIGMLLPPSLPAARTEKFLGHATVAGNRYCSEADNHYALIVRANNTSATNAKGSTNDVVIELYAKGAKLPTYTKSYNAAADDATLKKMGEDLYRALGEVSRQTFSATPATARQEADIR